MDEQEEREGGPVGTVDRRLAFAAAFDWSAIGRLGNPLVRELASGGRLSFLEVFAWARAQLRVPEDAMMETDDRRLRRGVAQLLEAEIAAKRIVRKPDAVGRPMFSRAAGAEELPAPAVAAPAPLASHREAIVPRKVGRPRKIVVEDRTQQQEEQEPMKTNEFIAGPEARQEIFAGMTQGTFSRLTIANKIRRKQEGRTVLYDRAQLEQVAAKRALPAGSVSPRESVRRETKAPAAKARAAKVTALPYPPGPWPPASTKVDVFMNNVRLLAEPWAAGILPGDAMVAAIAALVKRGAP